MNLDAPILRPRTDTTVPHANSELRESIARLEGMQKAILWFPGILMAAGFAKALHWI